MQSRHRLAVTSGLVLALLLLPVFSTASYAARIDVDNDVAIEWQQKAYGNFLPTVSGGNFIVTNEAELNAVSVIIALTSTNLLGGISLTLHVVDPLSRDSAGTYSEILSGSTPVTLAFTSGENNFGQPLPGVEPGDNSFHAPNAFPKTLSLSDFHNSLQTYVPSDEETQTPGFWDGTSTHDLLVSLLAQGPIGFSLDGRISGSVDLAVDIACQQNPAVCKTFPGSASITITGGQSFPSTSVPEPTSFSLLLTGLVSVAALRRRRN